MTGRDVDRRRYPRRPCDRTFEGSLPETSKDVFRCRALNASEGGLMLETNRSLAVGQKLDLFLRNRDRTRSMAAEVEVRWCRPHGEGFRCGVMYLSRREDYVV